MNSRFFRLALNFAGGAILALSAATSGANAYTRVHNEKSLILRTINEACKDRWCQGGANQSIKFDRFWHDNTSYLLSYVVHPSGSRHASRQVCRLANIKHFGDAIQESNGVTTLSEPLLKDIDACFQ